MYVTSLILSLSHFLSLISQSTGTSAKVKYLFYKQVPGMDTSSYLYSKALDTTKSGQDEIAAKKFKANHPSEDYSKIGKEATLAFNTSADRIAGTLFHLYLFSSLLLTTNS